MTSGPDEARALARALRAVTETQPYHVRLRAGADIGVLAAVLDHIGVLALSDSHRRSLDALCPSVALECEAVARSTSQQQRVETYQALRRHVRSRQDEIDELITVVAAQMDRTFTRHALRRDEQHRTMVEIGIKEPTAGRDSTSRPPTAGPHETTALPTPGAGRSDDHTDSWHLTERFQHEEATRNLQKAVRWLGGLAAGSSLALIVTVNLPVVIAVTVHASMSAACLMASRLYAAEHRKHRDEQRRLQRLRTKFSAYPANAALFIKQVDNLTPEQQLEIFHKILDQWLADSDGESSSAESDQTVVDIIVGLTQRLNNDGKQGN
ncbi:hypothetical protein ACFQV2_03485 [Actinokineospora soli]|uniref:SMODS and SLOG-associating 2TM effector domain-containing protein n=1 Tax=Actinokineospora soli TaxID=1048753 RepID=A0ABW2TH73_9PSEU